MADSTTSNATRACSHFLPTVTLFDWWLVKSPDNRLSISGISSRKGEAVRVFNSSPIVERFDVYSLKTADGIYILIRGIINEERTLEKGFTPEIFNGFYTGFPPNWETCWFAHYVGEQVEPATDSVNAAMGNVSAICEDISSDEEEKSISVLLELPEEAPQNNQTPFLGDECEVSKEIYGVDVACGSGVDVFVLSELPEEAPDNNQTTFLGDECEVSKEMSGVNVASGSGVIRRSTRLHSINICPQQKKKNKAKQQPTSRTPLKHPHEEPSSTSKAVENRYSDTVHLDNVSAILPEISSGDEEKSIPVLSELPQEAPENNQTSFPGDDCEVSKEMRGVNVASGSVQNRRSTRLHSINVCQNQKNKKKPKQQLTSRVPLKHPHEEPSSTSKAVENRDSDTVHLDNVSANLSEISSCAVENSFPTSSVTPEKATGHCNKLFLEGEEDMSIKTSEANVVHGSDGNRRSGRLRNVTSFQKKQPATGGPTTRRSKDQISASATTEKSDGGLENLSTPVQSQSGIVKTLSGQVTNKFSSKISKTSSAKTEVGHKKKKVTVETEAVNPKRKVMKSSSSVKSPQGRDASHLNKGSKQGLSIVSPESLSVKKSRSGRLLLPSLEFWRNEIPIYNADREIKEIQQDLTTTPPFRCF
ncbi:hypothetical protein RYX36_018874 [Vicia faba]